MFKDTLIETLSQIWPVLVIFSVIFSSVRITYLLGHRQKIVLYKEIFMLAFVIYVLVLFYVVTFQDNTLGSSNYTPFKELLRYEFGSRLFLKNVIGNMLLFVPFGLFVSYYINSRRLLPVFVLACISSVTIELTQSNIGRVFDIDDIILNVLGATIGYSLYSIFTSISKRMPKFLRKDWFKNFIIILITVLIILYFLNFDTALFGWLS